MFTTLWGNSILQDDFVNTFWEISVGFQISLEVQELLNDGVYAKPICWYTLHPTSQTLNSQSQTPIPTS